MVIGQSKDPGKQERLQQRLILVSDRHQRSATVIDEPEDKPQPVLMSVSDPGEQ